MNGIMFLKNQNIINNIENNNFKLNYDSAVQCEDIRSVSKARMGKYICKIDGIDMVEIKKE